MDHHCQWIGSCVGVRNYTKFILFSTFLTMYSIFVFFSGIQYFYMMVEDEIKGKEKHMTDDDFWLAFWKTPLTFPLVIFCFFSSVMLCLLTFYHYYLVLNNLTTNEMLKNNFRNFVKNPYDHLAAYLNIMAALPFGARAYLIPKQECPDSRADKLKVE